MILSKIKDPRLVTVRRGGSLSDADHRRIALWAAECAQHVLFLFEKDHPDDRPRVAIAKATAWGRGEIRTTEAKVAAYHANAAARDADKPAKYAAYAAGQAAVVAHVPEHGLGAAAYALRAVLQDNLGNPEKAREERLWQVSRLPAEIRALVLEDAARRNALCWNVFGL